MVGSPLGYHGPKDANRNKITRGGARAAATIIFLSSASRVFTRRRRCRRPWCASASSGRRDRPSRCAPQALCPARLTIRCVILTPCTRLLATVSSACQSTRCSAAWSDRQLRCMVLALGSRRVVGIVFCDPSCCEWVAFAHLRHLF